MSALWQDGPAASLARLQLSENYITLHADLGSDAVHKHACSCEDILQPGLCEGMWLLPAYLTEQQQCLRAAE